MESMKDVEVLNMVYPKVIDFLRHITTGTKVSIEDDITDEVYFEGAIHDYMGSGAAKLDLTLIQSYVAMDRTFIVRALEGYVGVTIIV